MTTIAEIMSAAATTITPDTTLQAAAQLMSDKDCGFLPVADGDRMVGMLTDRDITIRAVAQGKNSTSTLVKDVMSQEVKYCFDTDDPAEVAENMGDLQLRRLPVLNAEKRLVGIVSIGDLALSDSSAAGEALAQIAQRSEQHNQSGTTRK